MAKITPEEMARKLKLTGVTSQSKSESSTYAQKFEQPKKRGPYFKATPKKDALLTISTTAEVKSYIDERCMRERKSRSQLITEIVEQLMEGEIEGM